MMMINLYQTPPNMSSIGAVCDSLGRTFLLLIVDNLEAPFELVPSEGKAYYLSFVSARGECNIADVGNAIVKT